MHIVIFYVLCLPQGAPTIPKNILKVKKNKLQKAWEILITDLREAFKKGKISK